MSIKLTNVSHTYMPKTPFEKTALKNIDLEIEQGEFVAVIGHTGCGKSTLVQHFNGLLRPDSGEVSIDGVVLEKKNTMELRKKIGLVFQYPEHQLFEETVYKDIAFGLKRMKLSPAEQEKLILDAAEKAGLDRSLMDRSVYELSGGQKRRVAIAGVIVMNPSYLVLDEPAAGLDPEGKNEMLRFAKRLNKEQGTTIVLISHCMEDVAETAERVIVMDDGEILMDGRTSYVFSKHEILKEKGLDVPEITGLFIRLHQENAEVNPNIFTVKEGVEEIKRLQRKGVVLI